MVDAQLGGLPARPTARKAEILSKLNSPAAWRYVVAHPGGAYNLEGSSACGGAS